MKRGWFVWMLSVFLWGTGISFGQELDMFVRSSAANGRIRVVGREAEWIPRLSVWSERSLERLERDWQVRMPFPNKIPLEIHLEGEERVELFQTLREGQLYQRIRLPNPPDSTSAPELSQAFVSAMLTRLRWGTGVNLPPNPSSIQTAWTAGAAAGLVSGRSAQLAEQALRVYATSTPPSPERVQGNNALDSFLLYRWIQDVLIADRSTARTFWNRTADKPVFATADWIEVTPQVFNLRDLHQIWDVWWQAERRVLIAEFGLDAEARRWLMEELHPVPRFFGLDSEEVDPHLPTTLTDFEPYLDHPKCFPAMVQWIYRLQAVRFRQPPYLNAGISRLERALESAAQASRSQGGMRDRFWREALLNWDSELGELR